MSSESQSPMADDIAVSVGNLTKSYRLFSHPGDRIKQFLSLGMKRYHREFTALKDVSFDIKKGETIGIIGRNGSGKSTLLQLICGILKPTSGTVQVNGRVSALLELGAGFNPEFTGRENVYFQGALMGFAKAQMDERFAEIAAFADIGEFMEQPVRTYSSGMFVRLAFAVSAHIEPDILVIDEALAVGDAMYQKRCFARLRQLQETGVTVILVSHDHELIRTLTTKALLIEMGGVLHWGDTREATHKYRKMLFESEAHRLSGAEPPPARLQQSNVDSKSNEYGIGGARITGLSILGQDGIPRNNFQPGEHIHFNISVITETPIDKLNIAIVIRTPQGWKIYSWGTFNQDIAIWFNDDKKETFWDRSFQSGERIDITLVIEANLGSGSYEVQAVVSRELEKHYGAQQILHWRDEIGLFSIDMNSREYFFGGICDLRGKAIFHD